MVMMKTGAAVLYLVIGVVFALILLLVVHLKDRPDLKLWHEAHLDAEFTGDSPVADFAGYLALEEKLFGQLQQRVLDRLPAKDRGPTNRYQPGSLTDPGRWTRNWNRTFELATPAPTMGVLLLHGMSDSPYSLRALGADLNKKGAWVVGLRLPGHGTIPAGLVRLTWEDMAAAVRLAMRHLRDQLDDKPLFIIGYSTGGSLAVEYALDQLENRELPAVKKIVLVSPAIGVSRLAVLSVWQARLGRLLGLGKLTWNSIQPEYNSYKYNSFAINAAIQVYRLATTLQKQLAAARQTDRLKAFPPVLTFQSVVDATVSTPAVLTGLYNHLLNAGNELVVFDINRHAGIDNLLTADPLDRILALHTAGEMNYSLALVTNENPTSRRVVVVDYEKDAPADFPKPLNLMWPDSVHSLSHIALPFPENDPLYGIVDTSSNPGIVLSKTILRGERGVIQIPAAEILRLRWNPFYPYVYQRVTTFLNF
jgi:alpha-beta hydrolase superfamily lysophospholipase